MLTCFWLKKDLTLEDRERFNRFDIYTCPISEQNYIDTGLDFLDPATPDPSDDLADIIEEVTVEKYRIDCGFRTDGVYNHRGAVLVVQTHEQVYGTPSENPTQIERMIWQEISIRAMSVQALRSIYSKFRQGSLQPTEDWEANAKSALPVKHVEIKDFELDPPTKPNNGQFDWDKYHGKS
jgi:hypothetical protein